MNRQPPISTLFPYTTLSQSASQLGAEVEGALHRRHVIGQGLQGRPGHRRNQSRDDRRGRRGAADRKSTRLNSSHSQISYAVFCLKKKKTHHGRSDQPATLTK